MRVKKPETLSFEYSADIVEMFKDMGLYNSRFINDLSRAIVSLPRCEYEIDSSDNAIKVCGVHISFIRDWTTGKIHVMTNDEAHRLDMADAWRKGCLF